MTFGLDDLRSQILWCTAESVRFVSNLFSKTKICDSDVALLINQQILRLQIPVRDVHGMQVVKGEEDLACKE